DEDIEAAGEEEEYEDQDEAAEETAGGDREIDFDRLLGQKASAETNVVRLTGPPAGPAGLGFIVARLWEQRTEENELEVFLSEGEIVAPDYYSENLSTSDYGVFAVQEGDGTFAVTVIPWSSVRRVGLRRMGELPGELFQ